MVGQDPGKEEMKFYFYQILGSSYVCLVLIAYSSQDYTLNVDNFQERKKQKQDKEVIIQTENNFSRKYFETSDYYEEKLERKGSLNHFFLRKALTIRLI